MKVRARASARSDTVLDGEVGWDVGDESRLVGEEPMLNKHAPNTNP